MIYIVPVQLWRKKTSLKRMYLKHIQSLYMYNWLIFNHYTCIIDLYLYLFVWLYLKCILDSSYNNSMWCVCPCIGLGLWCLTLLSKIFWLYRGVPCIGNQWLKIVSGPTWPLFLKDISQNYNFFFLKFIF